MPRKGLNVSIMLFYKRTGIKDYIRFISQRNLRGSYLIFEYKDKVNSFLHLPKCAVDYENNSPDLNFWKLKTTVNL